MVPAEDITKASEEKQGVSAPAVTLPKGGGAIHGMGEKFAANPVTGTGSMSVPIAASPGRSGFGPQLSLSYDSGAGNGPFGFGWNLSLPSITRRTDKGLPRYRDAAASDVFILSGAEDLVPFLEEREGLWTPRSIQRQRFGKTYRIDAFRPRIEGLFARIERWTNTLDATDVFWRSISRNNITTWYGKTAESRIADPLNPARIFEWLICESHDDKGNVMVYGYKPENSQGIEPATLHERNRSDLCRAANRYLKRIRYGNGTPYFPDLSGADPVPLPAKWLFELVFDYGEHDADAPLPAEEVKPWNLRNDPFSTCRAGFEVRTYRLCQRALMFHHFPDEPGVGANCLVRSTDLSYSYELEPSSAQNPIFSFLLSAAQTGYRRTTTGGYTRQSMPPVAFEYSRPTVSHEVKEVDPVSLENLPAGFAGNQYQWVDLDGEGLSGILSEQAGVYYYKRNLSPGAAAEVSFGSMQPVSLQPSWVGAGAARTRLLDLAGDGQLDLVSFDGPTPGFFERTFDEGWEGLKPFESLPRLDWSNPNLRFVDLTGDGHADILITGDDAFCWYASLAEAGFAPPEKLLQALDEEKGPRLVVADPSQSIYLADMNGDGLTDLVRIRNGEVCYWPNLGYGCFGAKIGMDNAPWFGHPDQFGPRRIRLADIDGSGVTDIIYLAADGVDIYFNQSGNSWSQSQRLAAFPAVDDVTAVQVADLMGNGTACLVWSSPLPGNAMCPMRYVDLMGGQKPHLLVKSVNNLGAETHAFYAASTKFYVADALAGKPWITRIPFPVHVLERVETHDRIGGNRFVTRYAYHHGYFDGVEREFRGFGMVEQWDTEEYAALSQNPIFPGAANIDEASHSPPVLTKTWFHTGVYLGRNTVSNYFAGLLDTKDSGEYYRETGLGDAEVRAQLLPDTILPEGLTLEEERQACRSLKGAMLRQEVYALDGSTDKEAHPYVVTGQNFTIRLLQPQAGNRHAVFFTHAREALSYHYERNPADPRMGHALTLAVDDYGNVLKSAAIGYGRRTPDPNLSTEDQARQTRTLITLSENTFTNAVTQDDDYRTPLPAEARSYELTGLVPVSNNGRFALEQVLTAMDNAETLAYNSYEQRTPAPGHTQKRLIEHLRTQYRPNDLGAAGDDPSALLPPGALESRASPGEAYKLAFTTGLVEQVYADRVTQDMLPEGGYVQLPGDDGWWLPTGRIFHSPAASDTAVQELTEALAHFFIPRRFRDPFGNSATVTVDAYDLLTVETRDALDNTVTARNDYRVLQPQLLTDTNGNQAEAAFDALGMVAGTAVMGKPQENLGDSLNGFEADLPESVVLEHLAKPLTDPHAILQGAATRLVYDLFAYSRTQSEAQPQGAVVYTLTREMHQSDLQAGELTQVQHAFSYSDGFGREIQKKIQAEPGPLTPADSDSNPRWVGSAWTVFNNKGKPVRQYEPFFTVTHRYEFDVRAGVSPILCYDPLQRVVATLNPNHTWQKVVFNPWRQETWDVNDTVRVADPKTDPDAGGFFSRLPEADYLPTWHGQRIAGALGTQEQMAASKAAIHAETPGVAHMDTLGRTFLTIAHNRRHPLPPGEGRGEGNQIGTSAIPVEEFQQTHVILDIEGNQRQVIDALDRIVMRYDYDMLSQPVHSTSMEAGRRWMLNDVAGKPLYGWDSRNHRLRTAYDVLRRPTGVYLQEGTTPELLVGKTVYGESRPNPEASNLRGKPYQAFDGAGVVTTGKYDFKGNALSGSRQLAVDYKTTPDWTATVALEAEVFTTRTSFDALNRPVTLTAPDNSSIHPIYNEANLLERVEANLQGSATATTFVSDIGYNAKGQRERIDYGNGVSTTYDYDPLTFRLTHLQTLKGSERLQDLFYTYDPAGNITGIRDEAQQTIYFRNTRIEPNIDYTYDALYQLIRATGREHLGQTGGQPNPPTAPDAFNLFHTGLDQPGDRNAMGIYQERYVYDAVGNFLKMQHVGSDPAHPGWTRTYNYAETSLIDPPDPSLSEPGKVSNRLSSTQLSDGLIEPYTYDAHGSMTTMPHLPLMQWDYRDRLQASSRQVRSDGGTPEITYYVYDGGGQRVRKVTESAAAPGETPKRMKERIYLGGFEIYREYKVDGSTVSLERETLHLMDEQQRVALVETRTLGDDGSPAQLIRYQFGNHLGSASLELDEVGRIISYEEYFPYGSTSYQAVDKRIKAAAKRYRYTGMERDEETGLAYHSARYYAGWLGRWTAADPIGIKDGVNMFAYVRNAPTNGTDPNGTQVLPLLVGQTLKAIRDEAYRDVPEGERATAFLDMPVAENASRLAWGTFKVLVADTAASISGVANAPTSPETKLESNHAAGFNSMLMGMSLVGAVRGAASLRISRAVDTLEVLAVQDLNTEEITGVWSRVEGQIREVERTVQLPEIEVISMPEADIAELKRALPFPRPDTARLYVGTGHPDDIQVARRFQNNPAAAPRGDENFMSPYEANLHRITPSNIEFGPAGSPGVSASKDFGTAFEEFTKVNPFGNAKAKGVIVYDVPKSVFEKLPAGDTTQLEKVFYGSIPDEMRVDTIRVMSFPRPHPTMR